MQRIIIDEQFQFLLPALDEETYKGLETGILQHGCLIPLILWNGILIDGYNRYKICTEHDIPFDTVEMEFNNREEATIWIIENQIQRRNLTPIQLSYFRGVHYNSEKKSQGDNNSHIQERTKAQNEPLYRGSTATRLAEHYQVNRSTIKRNAKLAEGLTSIGEIFPEIKKKILSGEIRVGKNRLESLASASTKEIEAVIDDIESGDFINRAPRNPGNAKLSLGSNSIITELKELNNIISDFASNFNTLLGQFSNGESAELKTVLRSFINELEELYSKV